MEQKYNKEVFPVHTTSILVHCWVLVHVVDYDECSWIMLLHDGAWLSFDLKKKLESMNCQFSFHQKTLRNGWIPWKNWQRTGGYEGCYLRLWLPTYQNVIWRQTWWWCKEEVNPTLLILLRLGIEPNVETRLGAKTGEDFPDKVFISKFWRWCVIVPL
jgi:hypothetical protein